MTLRDLIDDGRVHVVDGAVGDRTISFQGQELGFDPPFKRIRLLDALGEALGEARAPLRQPLAEPSVPFVWQGQGRRAFTVPVFFNVNSA